MSPEVLHCELIYEYIRSAPATTEFFQRNSGKISRFVYVEEGHHGVNRRMLPWACFEGESPELKERNVGLFWEIIGATHADRRSLVIEVGPAYSLSPFQTACFLEGITVIGLDFLYMPNSFYGSKFLGDVFPNASVVLSFQLSTRHLDLHRDVNADRVQLIAHANQTLLEIIPESAKMLRGGGELLVVCEDDLQKRYPLLRKEVQKLLPQFTVDVNSISLADIRLRYGFSNSSHIQVLGVKDFTHVSVIAAKRMR